MLINVATVGLWKENSYQICYKDSSWLIDPGDEYEKLHRVFDTTKINGIICTHGHFDHVGAVAEFQQEFNLDFYLHSNDKRILAQANLLRKITGESKISKTPVINHFLNDISVIPFHDKLIKIHHLPGHTEGSVVIEFENFLFTGDIVFYKGLVKNDLPGGNTTKLINSLEFLVENFIDFTVYPGHGRSFQLDSSQLNRFKAIIYEYRNSSY